MTNWKSLISKSGLSIYSPMNSDILIPDNDLERILNQGLPALNLDYPLRTRSKVIKSKICEILGYPIPSSFSKTHPRFPNQNLNIYTQKADNIQVWNSEIDPEQRYAIIRVNENNCVTKVRVIRGKQLASWDKTGTLTHKYQARLEPKQLTSHILSTDSFEVRPKGTTLKFNPQASCLDEPTTRTLLTIDEISQQLKPLLLMHFPYGGKTDDRNRGYYLHEKICRLLCYEIGRDSGQFPDIPNQLLEIKLQTSPTIDLGLHQPDEDFVIDATWKTPYLAYMVRYLIIYASIFENSLTIENYYLCSGKEFFKFFPRFEGKIKNAKLQIPIPSGFI